MPHGKKVRQTVDVSVAHHQALAQWRLDASQHLDRPTAVTAQDAISALVELLLTDVVTSRKVIKLLRRRAAERENGRHPIV
jgi:hypothetical protein